MNSHELAYLLLNQPDMPVATHANNHLNYDGSLHVGVLKSTSFAPKIVIGNFDPLYLNCTNWWVDKCFTHEYPPEALIPDAGYIQREEERVGKPHPGMHFGHTQSNLELMKQRSAELVERAMK